MMCSVVRGSGHGQFTPLCEDGVVIDVSSLTEVFSASADHVCIGAGASWHDVIDALQPFNATTPAQTDWQGLSVGGIISVGG